MADYPEHERLREVTAKSQAIGEFLEWMSDEGIRRMKYGLYNDLAIHGDAMHVAEDCDVCDDYGFYEVTREGYVPDGRSIETLLADFFVIDRDKLEAEKRQMLEELRSPKKEKAS
jgi:hypothetical protein